MCEIVAVANHKGGSGKTTSTYYLGLALAEAGRRVLVVDLDDQATLTSRLHGAEALGVTVADVLDGAGLEGAIQRHMDGLDYVGADHRLAWIAARMQAASPNHAFLRQAWVRARLGDRYDFVLVDCPPSAGVLLINALALAGWVVVPATPTEESYAGLLRMEGMAEDIEAILNHRLRMAGVVATMVSPASLSEGRYLALLAPALLGRVPRRVGAAADEQLRAAYGEVAKVLEGRLDEEARNYA